MKLGYGPGEAIIRAHELRPDIVEPLAEDLVKLGLRTRYDVSSSDEQLEAMVALTSAVRMILASRPKSL